MMRYYRGFLNAWNGLCVVARDEHNFKIELFEALTVILFISYFRFSFVESSLCIFAIALVLGAEIINTAFEELCDKVQPTHDSAIGKIKDMAAALVLVIVIGVLAVAVLVFGHHFGLLV